MRRTQNTTSRSSFAWWSLPAALLLMGLTHAAHAIPASYRPYQTGYIANVYDETLHYDSSADRLSYAGWNRFDYSNRLCGTCTEFALSFSGLFVWSAGVNEQGAITDAGWMRWYGNLGSGLELLASGDMRDIGVMGGPMPEFNRSTFSRVSTLFDVDYLNPIVSGMGDQIWFDFEYQLQLKYLTSTLFTSDFDCGPGNTSSPDGSFSCSPFSHSGLIGLKVPEPGTLSLVFLGLIGLGAVKRRR